MIEEAYEVVEAIDNDDAVLLREELGDVLFQVMFHAQVEAEKGNFTVEDVVSDIAAKMVHRHPHVFGDVKIDTAEGVVGSWEVIKAEEKQRNTLASKLRAIPPALPALMRAVKVAKKTGDAEKVCTDSLNLPLGEEKRELLEKQIGEHLYEIAKISAAREIDVEAALSFVLEKRIAEIEDSERA
jgi:tetrapyrrole methylase family protein/MazG family protein